MAEQTIAKILGKAVFDADVGIEVEMEGKTEFMPTEKYWRYEHDGSLRGYAVEYVMFPPLKRDAATKALDYLKEHLKEHAAPVYSERAGVHVHVNMQEYTTKNLFSFALLYYCFEKVLVRYCGSNREGNHFCLRLCDADYIVDTLYDVMNGSGLGCLNDEDMRYSSLNFCSLFKYGTLEFRAMETQPDLSKIEEWVDMLLALRKFSSELEKYSDIPELISSYGPTGLAKRIFGEELFALLNYEDFDSDVMHCMRPIQQLLYIKA